jgi:biopolymer transport protein TolR
MARGGGFSSDDDAGRMIVDINVTPLVDITLVLLIVFMVTAAYIVNPAIKVDLPQAASGTETTRTVLALTLVKDGALYLNGERSSDDGVIHAIGNELPRNPELQAVIAADRAVPHGEVVHLIDLVKRAGVRRFAIDVDPGSSGRAR